MNITALIIAVIIALIAAGIVGGLVQRKTASAGSRKPTLASTGAGLGTFAIVGLIAYSLLAGALRPADPVKAGGEYVATEVKGIFRKGDAFYTQNTDGTYKLYDPAAGTLGSSDQTRTDTGGGSTVSEVCRLDKVSTINEVSAAGPQRIEVGGGGTQHVDYYPMPGVNSVSYIVTPQEPDIWYGYGSIWEGNGQACESFDWVADATRYATARLNNGHSGLVVMNGKVVANVGNLNQQQIDALLKYTQSSNPQSNTVQPDQAVQPVDAVVEKHDPKVNTTWAPSGEWRIVNFWTNQPGKDQKERKLLLAPDQHPALLGGGTSYSWPASNEAQARAEYAKNTLPEVSIDQLRAEGLIK